jgi:hypothetical protein
MRAVAFRGFAMTIKAEHTIRTALYHGSAQTPLVRIVPSTSHAGLWWLLWPDGRISDLANLSRIKDAAAVICERGPPRRDARRFRWGIERCESLAGGAPIAPTAATLPKAPPDEIAALTPLAMRPAP